MTDILISMTLRFLPECYYRQTNFSHEVGLKVLTNFVLRTLNFAVI